MARNAMSQSVATTFFAVSITFSIAVLSTYTPVFDYVGLILGSKIPVNIVELFVLFLERTIISLIIVAPLGRICSSNPEFGVYSVPYVLLG